MRISELSRASGASVATLKFYLREGLLPPGTLTAPNQAEYGEEHLRRLHLIRTLTEVGGLKLRSVKDVLESLDGQRMSIHEVLGVAHHALGPEVESDRHLVPARGEVDRFIDRLGWHVSRDAPARNLLARALLTLRRAGRGEGVEVFEPYARAADRLAARELAQVPKSSTPTDALEAAVVGTVAFESALVALRRLAQEHYSAGRFSHAPAGRRATRA